MLSLPKCQDTMGVQVHDQDDLVQRDLGRFGVLEITGPALSSLVRYCQDRPSSYSLYVQSNEVESVFLVDEIFVVF